MREDKSTVGNWKEKQRQIKKQNANQMAEQTGEQTLDQAVKQTGEQIAEQTAEQITEQTEQQTPSQPTEEEHLTIQREVLLDQIPGLYAVGTVSLDGELYYAAASENRAGKVFLVHAASGEASEIEGGQGGVMAVLAAEGERAILCIEEFYPVFDSATAKIVKVELENRRAETSGDGISGSGPENRWRAWAAAGRGTVAEVPYVHRIAQLREEDGIFIAAGSLCRHKAFSDDWSTSGCMEIGRYDPQHGVSSFEQVQDGIYKHHAMFVKKNASGYDDLYYGGSEGAFLTTREGGRWKTERILPVPVSDLVCLDLDGDGKDEIAVIEGFHGDKAVIFKDNGHGYKRSLELPMNFGHVLWGGLFLGEPGLIAGSRGGEKKLLLYRFASSRQGGIYVRSETLIDEGQAPAQLSVDETGQSAWIAAANHGAAQLVRYHCCRKTTDKGL